LGKPQRTGNSNFEATFSGKGESIHATATERSWGTATRHAAALAARTAQSGPTRNADADP